MSTRRGRWRVIARVDTPTLQYANMVALYGRQLWVMMMSRVVSWSWQTRALRRAAGNCVLYTYTTNIHTDGDPIRDDFIPGRALALTHTDTGCWAGLWTEGDPEGYLSCVQESALWLCMASMLAVHARLSYRAEVCLSAMIARRWPAAGLRGGGVSGSWKQSRRISKRHLAR